MSRPRLKSPPATSLPRVVSARVAPKLRWSRAIDAADRPIGQYELCDVHAQQVAVRERGKAARLSRCEASFRGAALPYSRGSESHEVDKQHNCSGFGYLRYAVI